MNGYRSNSTFFDEFYTDKFTLSEDTIVLDPNSSEEELERDMDEYESQPNAQKKDSDAAAIHKYGKTNQQIYDDTKSKFLKEPIDDKEIIVTPQGTINLEADLDSEFLEKNDIILNFEDWIKKKNNILFITGLSGSGKSTISESVAKNYKAELIHLDNVTIVCMESYTDEKRKRKFEQLKSECADAAKYFKRKDVPFISKEYTWEDKVIVDQAIHFLNWFIGEHANNGKQYVIEGTHLFRAYTPEYLSCKPCIIKGTSVSTTMFRRSNRDLSRDITRSGYYDAYVNWFNAFTIFTNKHYMKQVKQFNFLKDRIYAYTESADEEFMDAPEKEYNIKKYTEDDVESVITWALGSNINIVTPAKNLEELETMWYKYNSMVRKHKRVSDWKSLEVFGVSNQDFYEFQKSYFLAIQTKLDDYDEISKEDIITNTILSKNHDTTIDKILDLEDALSESSMVVTESSLMDVRNIYKDEDPNDIVNVIDSEIFPLDMPFYTPIELDNLGVFDDENNRFFPISDEKNMVGDMSSKEWYEQYKMLMHGFRTESYNPSEWVKAVRNLMYKKEILEATTAPEDELNKLNQSILELGWNPYIEFSDANRMAARKRVLEQLQNRFNDTIIDLPKRYKGYTENCCEILMEAADRKKLHPIHIVLVEGETLFSKTIKAVTKGPFSHAAICLDRDFEKLYSFNVLNSEGSLGGLSIESIDAYPKENTLGVYTIFVKEKDYKKIKQVLTEYLNNAKETSYNFVKCILLALKIPTKSDMNMICSEFVDNILKLTDIDLTGKASSLVNPNDFYKASKYSNKIYKIYEGKVKDFKSSKAALLTKAISNRAKAIKEAVEFISKYAVPDALKNVLNPLLEVKELPVKLDDAGNLYIKPIKGFNPENEYQGSHKLLRTYEENKNYEGMKYELCRLWFLNNYIESRLSSNVKNKVELTKTRARVLNDFHKYLKMVTEAEKDFNFNAYFEQSPFSDSYIKIDNSTIKGAFKLIKDILR